jgi:hypothetical protein
MTCVALTRHVIPQNDYQFRLELIRALNNQAQLVFVNERTSGMDIGQYSDTKAVQLFGPIRDRNCLLPNYETIGLNKKTPEDEAS